MRGDPKGFESTATKKAKKPSLPHFQAHSPTEEYIDTLLERHDHYAFEAKLDYRLRPNETENKYIMNAYFFVPRSLQIDAQSYPTERFIADLSTRIRFKTPAMSMRSLTRADNSASPLVRIQKMMEEVEGTPNSAAVTESVVYELKMLACIVKSSLRDQIKFYVDAVQSKRVNPDLIGNIQAYIDDITKFVTVLRGLARPLQSVQVSETLRETYRFVDDYVSLNLSKNLTRLAVLFQKMPGGEVIFGILRKILEQEMQHRKKHNSPLLLKEGAENELYSYWEGIFKKYTQSVLYLDQRKSEGKQKVGQILYAISAGIAMLLFIVVIVLLPSQSYLDWFIWLPAIAAYMLKDRIKVLLQKASDRALRHWFPDRDGHIFEHGGDLKIGHWKESVRYLNLEGVPAEVLNIRQASNRSPIEQEGKPEIVLNYLKTVVIQPSVIRSRHERHTDINDIIRFNIRHFLTYADDPYRARHVWQPDRQEFAKIRYAKVYHINVIFKLEYLEQSQVSRVQYKKIRVVIDQNGIKRVTELL